MYRSFFLAVSAAMLVTALASTTAHASTSLGDGDFYFWNSCSPAGYDVSGGVVVPEGTGSCVPDYVAAQESFSQDASGFSFYGAMIGGSGAGSSSDQEAVFLADNVSSFTGHEMGFIKTLNNNELQAYLQGPNGVFTYADIDSGDNNMHTFKAQVNSSNSDQVDFYLDGTYKCSLNDGESYNELKYTYVITTHRLDGGSWNDKGGEQIEAYDMTVY